MKFENINEARFAQNLSRAIQIATVSHENEDDTDWSAFAEFHQFLRDAYPKTFSTLEVEEVGRAGLILHWKGSDASLDFWRIRMSFPLLRELRTTGQIHHFPVLTTGLLSGAEAHWI